MLNVFLLTLQYEPKVFVSTRATFFTIVNTAKIALRVYDGEYSSAHASFTPFDERLSPRLAGSLDMGLLVLGLKLGIFSLLGVFVSTHVVKRLSKSLFMKMEYCLMTYAGGKLLYALHLFSPRLSKTPPHLHRDLPRTQVLRAARVILRSTAAGNVALARGCSSTANGGVRCECFQPQLCGPTAAETLMGSHWVWSCADGRIVDVSRGESAAPESKGLARTTLCVRPTALSWLVSCDRALSGGACWHRAPDSQRGSRSIRALSAERHSKANRCNSESPRSLPPFSSRCESVQEELT